MTCKDTTRAVVRVAVVDDDPDTCLLLKDFLQSAIGFRLAQTFSNSSQALTEIPRLRADVVIVDVIMPDLNGIECARRLKQKVPSLKIIIMTAKHDVEVVQQAMEAGALAYLAKPFSLEQCLATLAFVANIDPSTSLPSRQAIGESVLLSPRETQVLKLLAEGLLYKEIQDRLGISYSAVHKYQHNTFHKLHVSNRSEATRKWLIAGHS